MPRKRVKIKDKLTRKGVLMMLYDKVDWDKLRKKVWEQKLSALTLEEVFFIGSKNQEFSQEQVTQVCTQANLEFAKVKDKTLGSFTLYELRALLNTDLLQWNPYIMEVQQQKDNFRDVMEGSVVILKEEVQAHYGVRAVTIDRIYKRNTSHTSYRVIESDKLVMSYDIEK